MSSPKSISSVENGGELHKLNRFRGTLVQILVIGVISFLAPGLWLVK